MPLLETRQEVYDMLDSFDNMGSGAIREFFDANNISSSGVIDYATLVCAGALAMAAETPEKTPEKALVLMQSIFSAGVVLGIKLAAKRDETNRRATLTLVRPEPPDA